MAVIISRVATGMPVEKSVFVFADDSVIEDYAKEAVYQLTAQGIINGFEDGSFRPDDTATRAQAAKMICLLTELAE